MAPHPFDVVVAERGAGHDVVAVFTQPADREVALDSTPPVEHLGVGDAAHRLVQVVVAEPLEEFAGAATRYLDLGEGSLVEQAGSLPGGTVLRANG